MLAGNMMTYSANPLVAYDYTLALSGKTTTWWAAYIDTYLPTVSSVPDVIFYNLGANDAYYGMLSESEYKTKAGYILDAVHAAFPAATVYVASIWRRGYDSDCDLMATWNAAVIADGRSAWCHTGIDERGASGLEGTDNGAALTLDGIHPNAAGLVWYVNALRTVLGY